MSTLFEDIHKNDPHSLSNHRINGISFDEVLYADDTILTSTDAGSLSKLLTSIEQEGNKYGLRLNKAKCELVSNVNNVNENVKFMDGTNVPKKTEVKYLGCHLNEHTDVSKELKARISICMSTLKKLDIFWRHSDCPACFKIMAMDAVIRSKLLYGFESAQLSPANLQKLDAFQLKGLRFFFNFAQHT